MYIHWSALIVMLVLYIYLIITDIHLHRRVRKLEHTVRRLEGLNESQAPHKDTHEHEDFT